MKTERLTGVTARLREMKPGDELLDAGATTANSRLYSAARKMKRKYGMAFRGVGTPEGVRVICIDVPPEKPARHIGNTRRQTATEVNRLLNGLPIGGDTWVPDGPLADMATKKVANNLRAYVTHRDRNGWRVYRLA